MDTSDNIGLPYIMPSQAQKHVTHNEAIGMLDALVLLAVADRDLTAPPVSPSAGDRYIVAAGGTGAWDGEDGRIAHWLDGAWSFYVPKTGWLAFVIDEAALVYWTGSSWTDYSSSIAVLQNLERLGLGTTADAANSFAAKLNKALWTAKAVSEGGDGDLRYTMNKEAAADVLSVLLQSGFSGRAEFGLIGDDNFTLKVSADGSAWSPALTVDKNSGAIHAPAKMALGASSTNFEYNTVGSDLQIVESGLNNLISLFSLHAGGAGPNINQLKSRSGTLGSYTAVQAGDTLSKYTAWGDDGSGFIRAGYMEFIVDSAVSAGRVPGRFDLHLRDSTGTEQNILNVRPNRVGIGTGSPNNNAKVHVASGSFGGTQSSLSNQLILENSTHAALVFQSPDSSFQSIYFRDASDTAGQTSGYIRFDHANDRLTVLAGGAERLRLDSSGISVGGANAVIDANRHFRLRSYTSAALPSASIAAGQLIYCSDLGGGGGELVSDGTNWRRASGSGHQTIATDANLTLTPLTSAEHQRHTGTLTADRTIALSTTNAYAGARFHVTRTGGGTFNLSVGGLKNLAANTWVEVVYDGSAWYLAAYGAL
jgi:hypothetical protein